MSSNGRKKISFVRPKTKRARRDPSTGGPHERHRHRRTDPGAQGFRRQRDAGGPAWNLPQAIELRDALIQGHLYPLKAVEVGQLADLTKEGPLEVPRDGEQAGVVIVMGDYRAQSSAGFTRRVGSEKFGENFVVGGVGFTYPVFSEDGSRKEVGACLRPFRDIVPVTIVRANAVRKVATHANSNPETAAAAMVGLGLRPGLIVAEGQSDYTSAWQVEGASEVGEIPAEHRGDIFTPERLVGVAAGKKYRAANLKAWASEGWLEPIDRAPSKMTEALTALLGQELLRQTATSLLEESPVVETPVEG